MRIEKRADRNGNPGRYYTAFWTEAGRTRKRCTKCETKVAAERKARQWELERADPSYAAANAATVEGEALAFLSDLERDDVRPATILMYRQKAGHLVRCFGADAKLATIDANSVGLFVRRRLEEGAHRGTVYKELVALRQILKHAVAGGRYTRDPKAVMPARFSAGYVPRKRFLSWGELQQLLNVCSPGLAGLVAAVVSTGARAGEVEHINSHGGVVTIAGTKTEGSDRSFRVPSIYRDLHAIALRHGWRNVCLGNANRDMARACKRAGIPRVTMNDLRRTFGSLLVQAGVPPHLVGKLMGHTTSAMVEKVYGRQTPAALGSLVEQALATSADTEDIPDKPSGWNDGSGGGSGPEVTIKSPQLYLAELSTRTAVSSTLQSTCGSRAAHPSSAKCRYFQALSWGWLRGVA